jgi:hypothetical protein
MYGAMQSLSYDKVNYQMLWIMWLAKYKHEFMRMEKYTWQEQGIVKLKKNNTACNMLNLLYG